MCGNGWPEANYIDEWAEKHNIQISNKARIEIAKRMTQPRLELQEIREKLNKYFKDYDME